MGVEFELVCWKHREKLRLGKLREWYDMVVYFLKHRRKAIPKWLPDDERLTLNGIRRFQKRHSGCELQLINDHMDLYDDLCIPVDFNKSLPTKEDFVKYAEEHAVPIVINSKTVEFFVDSDTARKWGAKPRQIKVKFKKRVMPDKMYDDDEPREYSIYVDEDGNEYYGQ